jgi:allene oxide cyclase
MRKRWMPLVAAVLVAGVAITVSLVSVSSAQGKNKIHVIEHATTDTVVDTGAAGDSTGDLLTFHNDVYDATDTAKVGTDQGECIRIDPAAGSWECRWVTILDRGSITVEGPFYDTSSSTLAVTGGTGAYRDARGQMKLVARSGGTEYDFIFKLEG